MWMWEARRRRVSLRRTSLRRGPCGKMLFPLDRVMLSSVGLVSTDYRPLRLKRSPRANWTTYPYRLNARKCVLCVQYSGSSAFVTKIASILEADRWGLQMHAKVPSWYI